jgi:uncharacterized metal-binding protein YceD (DUF177 family)
MNLSVRIADIPPEGHRVEEALPVDWIDEHIAGGSPAFAATAPGAARFELSPMAAAGRFMLTGRVQASLRTECARCLGPVGLTVDETLQALVEPGVEPEDAQDVELTDDDLDLYHYGGGIIDLAPVIGEAMVLALPFAPLCKEDCAGLCNQCGADLNAGPCHCDRRPVDPRLAALKDIKLT